MEDTTVEMGGGRDTDKEIIGHVTYARHYMTSGQTKRGFSLLCTRIRRNLYIRPTITNQELAEIVVHNEGSVILPDRVMQLAQPAIIAMRYLTGIGVNEVNIERLDYQLRSDFEGRSPKVAEAMYIHIIENRLYRNLMTRFTAGDAFNEEKRSDAVRAALKTVAEAIITEREKYWSPADKCCIGTTGGMLIMLTAYRYLLMRKTLTAKRIAEILTNAGVARGKKEDCCPTYRVTIYHKPLRSAIMRSPIDMQVVIPVIRRYLKQYAPGDVYIVAANLGTIQGPASDTTEYFASRLQAEFDELSKWHVNSGGKLLSGAGWETFVAPAKRELPTTRQLELPISDNTAVAAKAAPSDEPSVSTDKTVEVGGETHRDARASQILDGLFTYAKRHGEHTADTADTSQGGREAEPKPEEKQVSSPVEASRIEFTAGHIQEAFDFLEDCDTQSQCFAKLSVHQTGASKLRSAVGEDQVMPLVKLVCQLRRLPA